MENDLPPIALPLSFDNVKLPTYNQYHSSKQQLTVDILNNSCTVKQAVISTWIADNETPI